MHPNEKNKTLHVYKIDNSYNGAKNEIKFIIKINKTGEVYIEFELK